MPGNFSYATSFPAPITYAAAFDDPLVYQIGQVVGKEARAFGNNLFSGQVHRILLYKYGSDMRRSFDFWTPNMNPFRDPRWGRGQETPGEDAFRVSQYVRNFVNGLQGDDLAE